MIEIYIFTLGLVFASFLGALMYRLEMKMTLSSMLFSRSHCDNCNRDLAWYELIPFFSWFIAKGQCRSCGAKIEIFYPLSELFLGIGFLVLYNYFHLNLWYYIFLMLLYSLSYYDYVSKSIPRWLTHLTLIAGLLFFIFNFNYQRIVTLEYFLGVTVVLYIINYFKKSFGFGDILLLAFFALILNPIPYIVFLLLTLYLSATWGAGLILLNRKNINAYIPLVPFMTVAFVLTPIFESHFLNFIFMLLGKV